MKALRRSMMVVVALCALCTGAASVVPSSDWPMYRGTAERQGYTADALPNVLKPAWTLKPLHRPDPAWAGELPIPAPVVRQLRRMRVDTVNFPIIYKGKLIVGSNADSQVRAYDAKTGAKRWSFCAEGPVRFAPAADAGRVYFGSDDGYVYCLDADTGKEAWRYRAAPDDGRLVGNKSVISRWPVRGGVAVQNGEVWFAAGFWPSERCYLGCLDGKSGKVKMLASSPGTADLVRGARTNEPPDAYYVSHQGYLTLAQNAVAVPQSRTPPRVFSRKTGQFIHKAAENWPHRRHITGPVVHVDGVFRALDEFAIGGYAWAAETGGQSELGQGRFVAIHPEMVIGNDAKNGDQFTVLKRNTAPEALPKTTGLRINGETLFTLQMGSPIVVPLVIAGNKAVCGLGNKTLKMVDLASRKIVWETDLAAQPADLAAAEGRLYVTLDNGDIVCFAEAGGAGGELREAVAKPAISPALTDAADTIVKKMNRTTGLCMDLAPGTGGLAMALAAKTALRICCVEKDPVRAGKLREVMAAAGLYGARIQVVTADPAQAGWTRRFADLVISGEMAEGKAALPGAVMTAAATPWRGIVCTGKAGSLKFEKAAPLKGAGNWTHFHADAANTFFGRDDLLKPPLRVRWFSDVVDDLPSRHDKSQPPVVWNGLMAVAGMNKLVVVNAFNGLILWEKELTDFAKPGVFYMSGGAAGGVVCMDDGMVFARHATKCLVFNAETGDLLREIATPRGRRWGYLAYQGGRVVGSEINEDLGMLVGPTPAYLKVYSDLLFACDAKTGKELWQYKPLKQIYHQAVAVGATNVYLIDRDIMKAAAFLNPYVGKYQFPTQDVVITKQDSQQAPGSLVAVALASGAVRWKTPDIVACNLMVNEAGGRVYASVNSGFSIPTPDLPGIYAFDTATGGKLWKTADGARMSLQDGLLVGGSPVHAITGLPVARDSRVAVDYKPDVAPRMDRYESKTCGIGAASRHLRFNRAGFGIGIWSDGVYFKYRGVRQNCYFSGVPANELLLQQDSGYGCACAYQIQAAFALEPWQPGEAAAMPSRL